MSIKQLDDLMTGETVAPLNSIKIVDFTHAKYQRLNDVTAKIVSSYVEQADGTMVKIWTNDCLGIVPVIVTPFNAMHEQNLFSADSISAFNAISALSLPSNSNEIPLAAILDPLDPSCYV